MTKIKICGITNLEDALLAIEMGVDALGFIFSRSPRMISVERAQEIIKSLPPFVLKVGVFLDEPIEFVKKVEETLNLDLLQFHGSESPEYVKSFRSRGIKAFRVKDESVLKEIEDSGYKFFVLDSVKKGEQFDWEIAIKAKKLGMFLLGGGLNPENIELALSKVSPYGVDACSGIESTLGKKDPLKLRDFIYKVRKWGVH